MIHVALLRGINVGGKHKVPMAQLRQVCADLGFTDVATYINSGNIVFGAEEDDDLALAGQLERAIEDTFGFPVRALVRTGADIVAIAERIPADWTNDEARKSDVVYLLDGIDPSQAVAALQPHEGIDSVRLAPGAVLWMVERQHAARSGLQRILGTPLYRQSTVRNVNTARKLAALVGRRLP